MIGHNDEHQIYPFERIWRLNVDINLNHNLVNLRPRLMIGSKGNSQVQNDTGINAELMI